MKFRLKSGVQRLVACLPDRWAHEVYYFIQRRWGRLQTISPLPYFRQALRLVELSRDRWPIDGPVIMEVGTGRTVNVPIALWLAGAKRILTYDLHRYLRPELVMESLAAMRQEQSAIQALFAERGIDWPAARFETLMNCPNAGDALALAQIEYRAPADATGTDQANQSIDLHISVNVLEHVPPPVLTGIAREAARVLRPTGQWCHIIDPSDHFAHTDSALNAVNFLRYDATAWKKIAGNPFMYQNRLRAPDYLNSVCAAGLSIDKVDTVQDPTALAEIKAGFPVHADFAHHSLEDLATVQVVCLARPLGAEPNTATS